MVSNDPPSGFRGQIGGHLHVNAHCLVPSPSMLMGGFSSIRPMAS
jgi:hypothetical protein